MTISPPWSPAQVSQFREEGYTIALNLFTAREVRAMRKELERMLEAGHGRDVSPLPNRRNIQFTPLDDISPLFRALPFHPAFVNALELLLGDPILLWLDQIYLKPAWIGSGNSWHEDNARFKVPDVSKSAGAWIALHDSSRANGTLEIVPGSFEGSQLEVPFRVPTPREESSAVAAEMPAGSVAFFNFGMLHCTRDNLSDAPRAAAAYHFLRQDNLPSERYMGFGRNIPITGPDASGGRREYGTVVAGSWADLVESILAS